MFVRLPGRIVQGEDRVEREVFHPLGVKVAAVDGVLGHLHHHALRLEDVKVVVEVHQIFIVMDVDVFAKAGLQKLKAHLVHVAALEHQRFRRARRHIFGVDKVAEAPVLAVARDLGVVFLGFDLQFAQPPEGGLVLVDGELGGEQRLLQRLGDGKVAQLVLLNRREEAGQRFQDVVHPVKGAQVVPVAGVVDLVEHLLALGAPVLQQLGVVDVVDPQLVELLLKLLHPAAVIVDAVPQLVGVDGGLLGVEDKEERHVPRLTVVLNLGEHLGKGDVVVAELHVLLLLKKDVAVLAVLVQRVDHLVEELVVEQGIAQDHLIAKTDAVLHIALQRSGQVRARLGVGAEGIVGELAVVDLGDDVFLPVKEGQRQRKQHKKEGDKYNL